MELQPDNSIDEEYILVGQSVNDPLVDQTFKAVDYSIAVVDDTAPISSAESSIENNSTISNERASSEISVTTNESQFFSAEETHWQMEELPLFPDQQNLIHDIGTEDTNDPQIPSADELQIVSRSTQLPCVVDTIIISDDEIEPPQTPTIDEVQQDTSRPAEQHPTVAVLPEPPQLEGRRLDIPHKYNTRMKAYKKTLSDFIAQEQEWLNRLRNNQKKPTAQNASTPHAQWLHSKDWVKINVLRVDIPIKKQPNYSLTKRYKTRKARSKKALVTATTSSSAECSSTTSTMGCVNDTSNQQ